MVVPLRSLIYVRKDDGQRSRMLLQLPKSGDKLIGE